ncbi:molybdopterin oxidoreductase, partial [Arcobacter sp. F155]
MSLSKNSIACPLDCYDTCEALYENGLIKGNKNHGVTNGKLCINFANLQNENFLKTAYYENKEITLE